MRSVKTNRNRLIFTPLQMTNTIDFWDIGYGLPTDSHSHSYAFAHVNIAQIGKKNI